MKIFTIIVAVVVLLLIGGAGFRLATMTPETEPLVDLGLVRTESDDVPAPAPDTAKQEAIARQLRGNAWEKETPAQTNMSESEEFDRADEILDSREEDLDEAKKKVKAIY